MTNDIITIRASSLGALFDCPARWAAIHIDGRYLPSNAKATLGKAVHASTAVYDRAPLEGGAVSIDESAAAAIDTIHRPDEEVLWEDSSPLEAEKIALSLHTKYCTNIAPHQQYRAVEVQCEKLEISDIGIALTGTTDRIRETDDGLGIVDIKTGKTAVGSDGTVKTGGHAYQMGVYELLAQAASGVPITAPAQIVGLNTAKTDAAQRVGCGSIIGARDVLVGDGEAPGILESAASLIHSGNFWGNPKSMMCHKSYCPNFGSCKYRM